MESKAHLKFDNQKANSDLRKAVINAADQCLKEMYSEINSHMGSKGKADLHQMREDEENYFKRMVIGYADAIMDSYGTGSEMDTTNPFFAEYRKSALWNRARNTTEIAGRPKGFYINIYGQKRFSSGRKVGINIEDKYKPQSPSYAFQRAEAWWCTSKGRINDILDNKISEYISGMWKYFNYS